MTSRLHNLAQQNKNLKDEIEKNTFLRDEIQQLKSKLEYYETFEQETIPKLSLHLLRQRLDVTIQELKMDRSEQETTLKQYVNDYEKSKENLEKAGIQLSNQNFTQLLRRYHKVCEVNNAKQREAFKKLYEVDNVTKSKMQQVEADMLQISSDIKQFVRKQNDVLNQLDKKLLLKIADEEKKLYESVLKTAKQEILFFNNLQDVCKNNNVRGSISLKSNDEDYEEDINVDHLNAGVYSVIMENFTESQTEEEDISKVKQFLIRLNYNKECMVEVKRLEGNKSGSIRPLKVTFSDSSIVDRLIQLPNGKTWFRGTYVRISRFKHD